MNDFYWMPSIKIRGYRPFKDILLRFQQLEIIVGAGQMDRENQAYLSS